MLLKKEELKPGTTYYAVSPKGNAIIGSYDKVPGCALIAHFELGKSGEIEPTHEGETEMWWDEQLTQKNANGERIYICDEREEWSESELRFREETDEDFVDASAKEVQQ